MKKYLSVIVGGFISFSLLCVSCKKDDKNNPAPKTKTDLLAAGSWKFSKATVGGTDVSAFIEACKKDNIATFAAAGTGALDEGATKCNAPDPQTAPFTWSFQTNETQLFISTILFTGGNSTFTLVTLTETEMVLSQNITVSGTTQNAVVTFVH
jgi:hypothetical protein